MMSLAMILLLGFFLITGVMVTSDVTNSATPSRHQKMTTTSTATATSPMMTEQRRVFDFERLQANLDHRQHRQHQRQQQQKQQQQSTTDRRVIPWVSIAVLLNILFFFRSIAAPFFDPLGEPRQATASSVYFSLLAFLYIWLASVTILTVLPQFSTNYNIITAAALFFYMVFVSICALLLGRLCIRGVYYIWLLWKFGGTKSRIILQSQLKRFVSEASMTLWSTTTTTTQSSIQAKKHDSVKGYNKGPFPVLIAFQRPFRRIFKSSVVLSAVLCFIYSHCWSRTLSAFDVSREDGGVVCRGIFLPMLLFESSPSVHQMSGRLLSTNCHSDHTCADQRSIWILWLAAIIGHLWAYTAHEFAGKHHKDYRTRTHPSSKGTHHKTSKYGLTVTKSVARVDMPMEVDVDEIDETHTAAVKELPQRLGSTISESISATMQKITMPPTTKPAQPEDTLPMVSWYAMMLLATAFDMLVAFKIFLGRFDARKMQVALQNEKRGFGAGPINFAEGVFDFSHCKHTSNKRVSNEEGFWFDWVSDVGDGFNSSYQVSRVLAQPNLDVIKADSSSSRHCGRMTLPRGKLLINGGDLAYPDPTPYTYENRFFRTFEDALPPPPSFRKEHISICKPALPVEGWDTGEKTESDDLLSSYPGPCTFLIPGNHDWFDGLATYTRYILSRDWLGGWLMPQRTSYFALKLPRGWWLLGLDLALDDDINIEQFHFFADVATSMNADDRVIIVSHVPRWVINEYENHTNDGAKETHMTELVRTHLKGRVKLRLAGDLHHYTRHVPSNENSSIPTLIVSGGGGAFLHPTHTFQDQIHVVAGEEKHDYTRVCAYPSTKVSRHLSWLNLWQFRWRNWRLDIFWALLHFGIISSFLPMCGVYDDYVAFNPSHNLGYLVIWLFRRVLQLFARIFVSGRVSLLFTLFIVGFTYAFTDSSNLSRKMHIGWSLAHAITHISSALICILFVECLAEFIVQEGLVVTQHAGGNSNTQSCGTGLATSIYSEFTIHFSHTLEDFEILKNTTNSTNMNQSLPSYRFEESVYTWVSSTFSWLYHEAPFLKTTLAVFDLPGIIGSTHVAMCDVLCSTSRSDCTYTHDHFKYQQLDRVTIIKYLLSIFVYFVIFAVPVAGNVFGCWLAISLNFLNCQYDAGFSSLRMEHWKNFLRLHIDNKGDLEVFAIGLNRVPKKWRKDPLWDGDEHGVAAKFKTPSWMWESPSKWVPWRSSEKFTPQIIDNFKIVR